jgi:hypothetical protein
MPADAEGYRMLAARCAEIAATAKTPQLKGMVPGSVHAVAETSNRAGLRNRIEIVEARGNLTRMV